MYGGPSKIYFKRLKNFWVINKFFYPALLIGILTSIGQLKSIQSIFSKKIKNSILKSKLFAFIKYKEKLKKYSKFKKYKNLQTTNLLI